jgi:YVTN family beta-propeller protein
MDWVLVKNNMKQMNSRNLIILAFSVLLLASCGKDNQLIKPYNGFPVEVGQIFIDKCATPGCHNDNSFLQEGRMSLSSWESAFKGSRAGAGIIPFRDDFSYLMYFINRDSALGPVQTPLMPFNEMPLTAEEVDIIRQWIAAGAPDINGNIKFSGPRAKLYVTNQGCDNVAVIDKATGLVMRYVDVGQIDGLIESPHNVKVSPDGQYWYVIYINGSTVDKFRTSDDSYVGSIDIGSGDWNTLTISEDGKYGFVVAFASKYVAVVDLEQMTLNPQGVYSVPEKPHGSALNPDFTKLYVTQQESDKLYRFDFTNPFVVDALEEVDLVQGVPSSNGSALGPHEITFLPNGNFAVTCQAADEVRFYNANEVLLDVVHVGADPVEMAFSASRKYLFVTSLEDVDSWGNVANKRGSVAVINYETFQLVSTVYAGFQPHGIATDDQSGKVYVTNRNRNTDGPAPHHDAVCGFRNGYMTIIDMNTLNLVPGYNAELSDDPYSIAIKF